MPRSICFLAEAGAPITAWPQRRRRAAGPCKVLVPLQHSAPSWKVDLPTPRPAEEVKNWGKDDSSRSAAEIARAAGTAAAPEIPRSAVALRRKVLALLNKLSCRNEATVVSQLLAMEPSTSQELLVVADLIYGQTIKDIANVSLYCRAAAAMNRAFPTFEVDEGTCLEVDTSQRPSSRPRRRLSLTSHLLQRCQEDFAKIRCLQEPADNPFTAALESASPGVATNGWTKEKSLSSLRLLGELYHCGWASPRILAQVLFELLRSVPARSASVQQALLPRECYVECACELVQLVVAAEGAKDKQAWNLIWGRLAWLKDARRLPRQPAHVYSQRVRFKLLDVLEALQPR